MALANKNARILWAVLTRDGSFDANHVPVAPAPRCAWRYPSGQVTLNPEGRPRMLVSTNKCVDTWTLLNSDPRTLPPLQGAVGGGIPRISRHG